MNAATGPAATLGRLAAVAGLTFKEAVRRRVFLIVLIVGAAIVSSAAFFPTIDPSGRLRLIEIWALRTVTFFSCLGAIFFAGFSLPSDFENRRVYTLVTKPVHKGTLFLGKLLGFAALLVVFLVLMAAITLGYIRLVAALSADFPELAAYPQARAASFTGEGRVAHSKTGDAIRATPEGWLIWRFDGLSASRLDARVHGRVKPSLARPDGSFALSGTSVLRARNPQTGYVHEVSLPVQTNRWIPLEFPRESVSGDGRVDILMRPSDLDLLVAGQPDSAMLRLRSTSFELNFLAGMSLILLQALLVLMITLAASTITSSPVSILLGIFLFFVGNAWGFVREATTDIRTALDRFHEQAQDPHAHARTPEDLPPWLLEASSAVADAVLFVVPDFEQYNAADWLLQDQALAASDLWRGVKSFAPLALVFLLGGLAGMSLRDFAT